MHDIIMLSNRYAEVLGAVFFISGIRPEGCFKWQVKAHLSIMANVILATVKTVSAGRCGSVKKKC